MDDEIEGKPNGATPKTAPSCASCPFYFPFAKNPTIGACRRHAPMPVMVGQQAALMGQPPQPRVTGYFPETNITVICGEHPQWDQYVEMRLAAMAEHVAKAESDAEERRQAEEEAAGRA